MKSSKGLGFWLTFPKFLSFMALFLLFLLNNERIIDASVSTPSSLLRQSIDTLQVSDNSGEMNIKKSESPEEDFKYVEGEILIQYNKKEINIDKATGVLKETIFLVEKGLKKIDSIKSQNIVLLKTQESKNVQKTIEELKDNPYIQNIQPNYIYYPTSISTNDPYKNYLWGLHNTGQLVGGNYGIPDADIDAPESWERSVGENIVVAVIDSGVDYNHPDLVGNMWDGTNCVNDSGGILGGCNHGYDYVENDKNPLPSSYLDFAQSHGTHIAGTIASVGENGTGIIGVAPKAKIMALRTNLTTAQLVKAINFAHLNGAKIINASFGGASYDSILLEAINVFDGLFVASAGNSGNNHDSGLHSYPCDYSSSHIICVAATDQSDNITNWSDYGSVSVDLGAPGTNIFSTVYYNVELFDDFSGTSPLEIPNYFLRGGVGNYWGVRRLIAADGHTVLASYLYGDTYKPYWNNSNTYLLSPSYNLQGRQAAIRFDMLCDNELSYGNPKDYMYINFSSNGGVSWGGGFWWDEYVIDNLQGSYRPIGFSQYAAYNAFQFVLPSEILTNQFKFAFGWVSDYSLNDYWGCGISNLYLISNQKGYYLQNGTSMAAPHVAGVAALILAYRPELTTTQIKEAILNGGDSIPSLVGKTVTGKRLNAYNSLVSVQGDIISSYKFAENNIDYSCNISEKLKEISCRIPGDIPKTNLAPTISLTGGSIFPESGISNNFHEFNKYTLTKTAPYPAVEEYTVSIEDYFRTMTHFRSGIGNWGVTNTKYTVSGDFNGDGIDEIAAMYDYGNEDMSIIVFDQGEQKYPTTWFRSGIGNWGVQNTKYITAGDFNGNGKDEIAAMYDYGNEDMAIIIFSAEESKFIPATWFRSGVGNWGVANTKYVTAGDFNGDGTDEIAAMYDYRQDDMAIIVFDQGEQQYPSTWFRSGVGNWGVANTRYTVSGDFNNDGKDELTAMYDYGNDDMAIIVFDNGKHQYPSTWFRSGVGNWGVPNTKYVTSGDFNGNGIDQLVTMYDYGGEDMAIIMFSPSGPTFTNATWFRSGVGNWGVPYTKHLSAGDYNGNGIDEISSFYDYGREDMAVILFK